MARNIRRNRTTEAQTETTEAQTETTEETSAPTEGQATEETSAGTDQAEGQDTTTEQGEGGAGQTTEGVGTDPFAAAFEVEVKTILDSEARAKRGETFVVQVQRLAKRTYTASLGETVSGDPKQKAKTAIAALIRALGLKETEVSFDAEAVEPALPEQAGDNVPSKFFFEEETEAGSRLAKVAAEFAAADDLMTGANRDTKAAWLGMGRAYNAAKAIFAEAGLSESGDEAAQVQFKTAWGKWMTQAFAGHEFLMETFKRSKNTAAQTGFFATAPAELLERMPNVGTPSTFERKVNEMVQAFASQWSKVWVQAKGNEVKPSDDDISGGAQQLLGIRKAEFAKAMADWTAACAKAADIGKPIPAAPDQAPNVLNIAIDWLDGVAMQDMDGGRIAAYGESKLGKAMLKSWDALSAEGQDKATKEAEEAEEKAAAKAVEKVAKRFADMEIEDAARHLFSILRAHDKAADVLETLHEQFDAWVEEVAAKEAAAAEAAKAAADKAAQV